MKIVRIPTSRKALAKHIKIDMSVREWVVIASLLADVSNGMLPEDCCDDKHLLFYRQHSLIVLKNIVGSLDNEKRS